MNRYVNLLIVATVSLGFTAVGCAETGTTTQVGSTTGSTMAAAQPAAEPAATSGFVTLEEDGRLWVFRAGSEELDHYRKDGELAKHVILPKAGPGGVTLKGPDRETLDAYLASIGHQPGSAHGGGERFVTLEEDGRLWVFRAGSEELDHYRKDGELAKHVILPKAGPGGVTLKGPDRETLDAYLAAIGGKDGFDKPGFVTKMVDGRLWVFRAGSKELAEFEAGGELAKHVTRPKAGPGGITLKAPDSETLDAYLR